MVWHKPVSFTEGVHMNPFYPIQVLVLCHVVRMKPSHCMAVKLNGTVSRVHVEMVNPQLMHMQHPLLSLL